MKLDFKRFKKISSNAKSTTLQHPDGHHITIAHAKLSPTVLKELSVLPAAKSDGGEVEKDKSKKIPGGSGSPAVDPKKAEEMTTGASKSGWNPSGWAKNIKEGLGLAEGGEVPAKEEKQQEYNPAEYIPVPKELLQQHLQNLQQLDAPGRDASAGLMDYIKSQNALDNQRMSSDVALLKDRVKMAADPNAVGPRQPGMFDTQNPMELENAKPIMDLATVGMTGKMPFHERAAAEKAAQAANRVTAGTKTAAEANNLSKGVQNAGDVANRVASDVDYKQNMKGILTGLSDGGEVKKKNYDDGGTVDVSDANAPIPEQMAKAPAKQAQDPGYSYEDVPAYHNMDPIHPDQQTSNGQNIDSQDQEQRQPAGIPAPGASAPEQVPQQVQGDTQAPNVMAGLALKKQAILNQGDILAEMGNQQARIYASNAAHVQNAEQNFNGYMQSYQKEIADREKDIQSGLLKRENYWNNHSKTSAVIGLILGGLAARSYGGQNIALQALQSSMQRDLEQQRINLGAKQSLLSATMHHFSNMHQASNMAMAYMNEDTKNQIAEQASKFGGAWQQEQAKQLIGQLDIDTGMRLNSVAAGQALQQAAGRGSEGEFVAALNKAQVMNPQFYKDAMAKYVPGVGTSRVPVSPQDREAITSFDTIKQRIGEAISFQDAIGKTGAWTPENVAKAQNLKNSLAVEFNKVTGLKRLNELEMKNYNDQVGRIGSVNAGGVMEKLQDIKGQIDQHQQAMYSNLGIKPFEGAGTANTPNQPMVQTMNGVQYMKVPGGWKPIKK